MPSQSSSTSSIELLAEQRRLALDAAGLGWWHLDPSSGAVTYDERFKAIFGVSGDQLPYEQIIAVMHPDDRERVDAAVSAATRPDVPQNYVIEYRVVHADSSVRWVRAHGRAYYREASGPYTSFVGTVADITAEKIAAAARESLAHRLKTAVAVAHLGTFEWNLRTHRVVLDERSCTIFGMPQVADVSADEIFARIDPGDRARVQAECSTAIERSSRMETEYRVLLPDGLVRTIFSVGESVPGGDVATGRDRLMIGFYGDVTDARRQAEERETYLLLAQENREKAELASLAKDEFLATASHELRTPLNAILGWAQMIRTGQLDASGFFRAAEIIERNAKLQVQLIEDILDGSRIITGKLHIESRAFDMVALIESALEAVRPAADAKQIVLMTTLDANAAELVGDPERLQQVLWNLVNNAIKFTPKQGRIEVRLERVDTSVHLVVQDSGKGISAEFLPYVFDRFRQAEGSTTRRFGGLGLGLALVHHLVEAHGGSVRAHSEGEGRGSTFTVVLPVPAVHAPVQLAEQAMVVTVTDRLSLPQMKTLSGVTVLVVDDEPDARDLVATVLRADGADVIEASNAEQAIELLIAQAPMLMISDIGMPNTDGYELMRRVRKHFGKGDAQMPAIALTAYARQQDRKLAIEAGFHTHVAKPVRPAELLRVVTSLLQYAIRPAAVVNDTRKPAPERADTFQKFRKLLETRGLHEALVFLNSRTPHRFTGLYKFDGPTLRNVYLVDSYNPECRKGEDSPMAETYCSIVGETKYAFTTEDARVDERLRSHPARETVLSYCGVLLKDDSGKPFGTLCHFDLVPCDVPVTEIPLVEAAAALIMKTLSS